MTPVSVAQVRDYGALLKLAKFSECFAALKRLLLVFTSLAPGGLYSKALMLYILLLQHWDKQFPTVAKIWKQHLPAFVEEDGELSFSVLSRTVLGDTTKSSFATLNKAYKSQQLYKEAMADFDQDANCFSRTASLHTVLDEDSAEVKQLAKFLSLHFQSIQAGKLNIYTKLTKDNFAYSARTSTEATSQTISLSFAEISSLDTLNLSIPLFESASTQHKVDETLNSIEKTLFEDNYSGAEIRYILQPEELESVTETEFSSLENEDI